MGLVNNARLYCLLLNWSKAAGLKKKQKQKQKTKKKEKEKKKKKKKGENALKSQTWMQTCVQTLSKLNFKNDIRAEGIFHPLTLWDSWKLRKICLELTSLRREFGDEKVQRYFFAVFFFFFFWGVSINATKFDKGGPFKRHDN